MQIQMLTLIPKTLWGGWISFHSNHVLNGTQIGPWRLLAFKSVFNNESWLQFDPKKLFLKPKSLQDLNICTIGSRTILQPVGT